MGKSKKTTQTQQQTQQQQQQASVNQNFDPLTNAARAQAFFAANGAARAPGVGLDPSSVAAGQGFNALAGMVPGASNFLDASQGFGRDGMAALGQTAGDARTGAATLGNAASAGNRGLAALGGDAQATAQLSNPYQQQVIGAMDQQNALDQKRLVNGVNDQAQAAGAFGGSRQAVTQAAMQAGLARDQSAQKANLLSAGYGDAMGRANTLAQFGQNAAGQMYGAGNAAAGQAASLGQNAAQTSLGAGQAGVAGQAAMGEYGRGVAVQNDPNNRALGAWQQYLGMSPVATNTTTNAVGSGTSNGSTTSKQGGDLFGDLLGLGSLAGGFFGGRH